MEYILFSGGEVHLKVNKMDGRIVMRDYSMNGFMALCQQAEVLRRHGFERIEVVYPYVPYARQDRVMESNEPFSLKVFADLLNSQRFSNVTIVDPHSDVSVALINNCNVWHQHVIAPQAIPSYWLSDEVIFVSPDAGAYKKVQKLAKGPICIGVKARNAAGEITHTEIFTNTPLNGRDCIIIDDICDGGRTFIELAKALKEKEAARIHLYVTHGIFSKGLDVLKGYIDHVYTTNTFPNQTSDFVTVKDII